MFDASFAWSSTAWRSFLAALTWTILGAGLASAGALAPLEINVSPDGSAERWATYSPRTLRVAVEVDRDGARLLAYTMKDFPLIQSLDPPPRSAPEGSRQGLLEFSLAAADGRHHARSIDLAGLCLDHGPADEPHVEGDTIRLHRDTFTVELPESAGLDRLMIVHLPEGRAGPERVLLENARLDRAGFDPAGSAATYASLTIANDGITEMKHNVPTGELRWPEGFDDPDIYTVFGNAAEGSARVNITIVPDGYAFSEKALMEEHAAQLVAAFRRRTPYKEHDRFINYTLVYAYSAESGTDQCDCGTIVDTAMGTGFPPSGNACGSAANRCLYYGAFCDDDSAANIALAELRAPFHDTTVVMVNTPRYGGCGGTRAVYSAGNAAATEIAIHELGHSLAGLADEYGGSDICGGAAGEINTSADGVEGAWPEWIGDLGPPREGAQYYHNCLFRPSTACQMRTLSEEFCPVCRQHWARLLLGHERVRATAPIAAMTPGPTLTATAGEPVELAIQTRLPGGGTVNRIDWFVSSPTESDPEWVAGGQSGLVRSFTGAGVHRVSVRVIADAEFIKPARWGDNVDVATFEILVVDDIAPPELAPPGSASPLLFEDGARLVFGSNSPQSGTGYDVYNVYRGDVSRIASGDFGSCLAAELEAPSLVTRLAPAGGRTWFFLAAAVNAGGEGSLGSASSGEPRTPLDPCN